MSNLVEQGILAARRGENPRVITRLPSGWLVIGDVQPLPGYCVLLADPIVAGPEAMGEADRARYAVDMFHVGDALMAIADAYRINYETLGNLDPSLHTHIIPRFMSEPDAQRRERAAVAYDWAKARLFDPATDGPFMGRMRAWLEAN